MTTIAYRDGVLAADSQRTAGRDRCGTAVKIGRKGSLLFGATGDAAWGWEFRCWIVAGARGEAPIPDEQTGGFIIMPDDQVMVRHIKGWELRGGLPFFAEGSGQDYALGAMQVGATAAEAVAAAAVWDTATGGEVVTLSRRRPEWGSIWDCKVGRLIGDRLRICLPPGYPE